MEVSFPVGVTRIASMAVRWRPISGYFPRVFDAITPVAIRRSVSLSPQFGGRFEGVSSVAFEEVPSWD